MNHLQANILMRVGYVLRLFALLSCLAVISTCSPAATIGDAPAQSTSAQAPQHSASFFHRWQQKVAKTQAEQPAWITPLVTVTPRLEQEFRFDTVWQQSPTGATTVSLGNGKGLELIPAERVEVIVGIPPYLVHDKSGAKDGFGDESFLVKYRIASATKAHGNYIVTAFLGASIPSGSYRNGAEHGLVTPTIAAGKGWGNFDVQSTLGITLPTADAERIGHIVASNTAFQYRVLKNLWPEVEINASFFESGPHDGEKQVFLTPGLVVGKIPLHGRLGLTFGAGVQIAASQFYLSNHNWILSVRMPF